MKDSFPNLVDPITHYPLEKISKSGVDILIGKNGTEFKINEGIARILPESENYADAFGQQWLRWRKTQLDSHSRTNISSSRLNRCLGNDIIKLFLGQLPMQVLEVGCGAGRFTEILLKYPAVNLTSTDLSLAVEANQMNFPQDNRHRIVQSDIMNPPFEDNAFDVVLCIGVIQHTPSPEKTIEKLLELVKPGGYLVIDHYTPEIKRLTKFTSLILRPVIKRLSATNRMSICERLVSIFFPLHKLAQHIPGGQAILSRISPINTYFHTYPQIGDKLHREWALLDTHDGLTDWYKHLRTPKQIKSILMQLKANSIEVFLAGNGVEARCRKMNR
jgi:SAM-dependent methyltransferase